MNSVSHIPGKFVWFEHHSPDPAKAQAFYGALLGWKSQAMPMGGQTYNIIMNADSGIGGMTTAQKGAPSTWMSYLSVANVDASHKKALANGAKSHMAPMDFGAVGRAAVISDPTGASLSLWKGAQPDRPDVEKTPLGDWFWNELWTENDKRALTFYEKTFGYSHDSMDKSAEQNGFALATLSGGLPALLAAEGPSLRALRVPPVAAGLPSEMLLRRPDVRLAEANLATSNADVTAARAALFPRITLTGSGGIQSLALETLLRPGSVLYNLAAGVTQPIFDGGSLRAQVEQARGVQEENLANYRRSILAALEDTETGLSALRRTTELVALQEAREAAARRAFQIADGQLRAGTIDLLTVLNTQATLFSARDALALAVTQRLQAAASLFTALGGGWTMPEGRIAR